jgi:maltose alpha-D-glucosyltransferase / alpha-amylase
MIPRHEPLQRYQPPVRLEHDPLWYKKAVIYQAHVRSYCDSDADGVGDFRGLTQKLDYLQELGITALWLLPFYPSPLRDEGYDIADYYDVNPAYGTLSEFKALLREAHDRGLRVITELVINHTSDRHKWFQKSRRAAPGTKWREFYVWTTVPEKKYREARIIFKDFEPSNWTWDPLAKAYYWHRFYSHQPDLNFDNPDVHREIFRVLDFWLDLGVDGLRLDAIPYLYEREGTSCENLPETHAFLKKLRAHVDAEYSDRVLLAEANQWPEDSAAYFGQGRGDECHMAFHFPLMPRLFMAVRMEDRVPIVDILEQTPSIPETSQWAIFLRNHDELTLEMVTDEERDYMYRVYAQDTRARINLGIRRRLAPLLGNDRKRIELLNALLLSMPGTPVLYYGDEIGMGDNIFLGDRNGVRTPMQWSSDKNAGFSRANPQSLYLPITLDPEYHYEAINVEAQQHNPHSLLWWTKRLLALRKRYLAFGMGNIEFLQPENRKILAFIRRYEQECILVVCNLSRFVQAVELDLSAYQQTVPLELFGHNFFPPITDKPYFFTLGPHSFYWFALMPRFGETSELGPSAAVPAPHELPVFEVEKHWEEVLEDDVPARLEACLQGYIPQRRWFGARTREVKSVQIRETIPMPAEGAKAFLLLLGVEYVQGDTESYQLPLAFAVGDEAKRIQQDTPHLAIARLHIRNGDVEGLLHDGIASRVFGHALLEAMRHRKGLKGVQGEAEGISLPAFRRIRGNPESALDPVPGKTEQSNSSMLFGDKFILKLFRRLEEGPNPDLEIGRFLAEKEFPYVPPLAGALEYHRDNDSTTTSLAILHGFIPNCKDAWAYTLDTVERYYERVNALPEEHREAPYPQTHMLDAASQELPLSVAELLGTYAEAARLLGERTASLHLCLESAGSDEKDFAPEPFNPFYQRGLFQTMRNQVVQNMALLRRKLNSLPEALRADAERAATLEGEVLKRLRTIADTPINTMRLRIHGDYHLGQVLHTGKDFLITDFGGESARPLSERRLKRTPVRDVAGMLRSFYYAAFTALYSHVEQGTIPPEAVARLEPWAQFWAHWTCVAFLRAYLGKAREGHFLPQNPAELKTLLDVQLLHKVVYELGYELNNRPAWLRLPLQGLFQLTAQPK